MRASNILKVIAIFLFILNLNAEGKGFKYLKLGWGYSMISGVQSSVSTTLSTNKTYQNIEYGVSQEYLRYALFFRKGRDTIIDNDLLSYGYKLGLDTKLLFEPKIKSTTLNTVVNLESAYNNFAQNSKYKSSYFGYSIGVEAKLDSIEYLLLYLEYHSGVRSTSSTDISSNEYYYEKISIIEYGLSILF